MIRRAEPYASYNAVARIEQGEGLPAKLQAAQFPAIGQAIAWGSERVAHDPAVSAVHIYGVDESREVRRPVLSRRGGLPRVALRGRGRSDAAVGQVRGAYGPTSSAAGSPEVRFTVAMLPP